MDYKTCGFSRREKPDYIDLPGLIIRGIPAKCQNDDGEQSLKTPVVFAAKRELN